MKTYTSCQNPLNNPKCKGITKCGGRFCTSCAKYGRIRSEEAKRKTSESLRGRPKTEDWIRKVRATKSTSESKAKSSASVSGERNPFYGMRHSLEALEKMRKAANNRTKAHCDKISAALRGRKQTEETCRKKSEASCGENNPFYGRRHTAETKLRISKAHKGMHAGCRNPMYGKPSPHGASYGVSGWLGNLYFRSTCELNFLISHQNTNWETAESNDYAISFVDAEGNDSYYFPDFYGNGVLVEVKPFGWDMLGAWDENAQLKMSAAVLRCEEEDWEYLLVQLPSIPKDKVFRMRQNNDLKLDPRWERKYEKWLERRAA